MPIATGLDPPGCCPITTRVELVGKRWTGAIVVVLMEGGADALLPDPRPVPELSDRLLSERMKELEARGVVVRRVIEGSPTRVEYGLTRRGGELEPALASCRTGPALVVAREIPPPPRRAAARPLGNARMTRPTRPTRDDVEARAERDVRFIRFWFTDILGQLKSFSINAESSTTPSRAGWASTGPRSPASTRSRSPT